MKISIIVDFKMPKGCPETGLPLSIYIFFMIIRNYLIAPRRGKSYQPRASPWGDCRDS